jgi:hypothetical protein
MIAFITPEIMVDALGLPPESEGETLTPARPGLAIR